jgi:hypothetical protein
MKVIAKVDSQRVLCEVSIEELAFLNGYKTTYTDGCDINKMSAVGAECNLKKMVVTSQFVRSIRPAALKETKEKLQKLISNIEEAESIIAEMEVFNILSEEKQIGE